MAGSSGLGALPSLSPSLGHTFGREIFTRRPGDMRLARTVDSVSAGCCYSNLCAEHPPPPALNWDSFDSSDYQPKLFSQASVLLKNGRADCYLADVSPFWMSLCLHPWAHPSELFGFRTGRYRSPCLRGRCVGDGCLAWS